MLQQTGLVLSGGGARGAYQAGVLSAVAHIADRHKISEPFQIYTGVSAGAINVGLMTANSGTFSERVKNLTKLWSNIESDQVFYADLMALSRGGIQWMTELSLGGSKKDPALRSLLSTQPLHSYLSKECHFAEIEKKIKAGKLRAVGISALDYESISTVTYYQAAPDVLPWEKGMHYGERTPIKVEHIMASSAIPLLFPPIKIGDRYFGDGCIRNQSPCGPAIYMGAQKILAIGVRRRQDTSYSYHNRNSSEVATVSKVANALMNAVMMDGLESDIQRIDQINRSLHLLNLSEKKRIGFHEIENVWISPSVDFADVAEKRSQELPRMIRYLLRGPGSLDESGELLSYLLFTSSYCRQLIEIGFADGMKERDQIEEILLSNRTSATERPSPSH